MEFKEAIQAYAEEPLTRGLIMDLLKDYKRPYDKISELVKKGELIAVKRGIYVPGPKVNVARPESFLLANHLHGPSYVSLETALSYHGMIPERVYEITSVTTTASKTFKTPVGRFSYHHGQLPYYSFGIESVLLTARQRVLIASPEKALCDKILMTRGISLRSVKQAREFLTDDMRIDEEQLSKLDLHIINAWIKDAPKQNSLKILVKTLQEL